MHDTLHRLLRRQLQRASRSDDSLDVDILVRQVSEAYAEADRERRRNDRAALLMCEEMDALHEALRERALHDPLTGLANRTLLRERLQEAADRAVRGYAFALLYLDLDHFKAVNDKFGHATGDRLLVEVAARVRAQIRLCDTLARLGGDEFALVLSGIGAAADAGTVARRIVDAVAVPFDLSGDVARVGASIGVAVQIERQRSDIDDVMQRADRALYRAKHSGRNCWRFGNEETICLQAADQPGGLQCNQNFLVPCVNQTLLVADEPERM